MKRIIKDYKNITPELLDILNERYPEGIDEDDLISFKNHLGELISAVEIRYEDDIYLIKVSKQLTAKMDEAMEDDEDEDGDDSGIESDFEEEDAVVVDDVEVDDDDDDDDFDDDDDDDDDDDEKEEDDDLA
jgi:hypothetical protein